MRRLALLALALLLVPPVAASEPFVTLVDWTKGHHVVATRAGVDGVDLWRAHFPLDECRRALLLDLLYSPEDLQLRADGVGEVAMLYEFRAEVWTADGATRVSSTAIRASGYGKPLGTMPEAGAYELRLFLANGAGVDWSLRLRAREVATDPACLPRLVLNEVELDPAGAAPQWIEIHNPGDEPIDAGAWTLRWDAGAFTIPDATIVAPGARVVVEVPPSNAIPTAATLALDAAFGYTSDTTPLLVDDDDDARTWQRVPDTTDSWTFTSGTPGAPN